MILFNAPLALFARKLGNCLGNPMRLRQKISWDSTTRSNATSQQIFRGSSSKELRPPMANHFSKRGAIKRLTPTQNRHVYGQGLDAVVDLATHLFDNIDRFESEVHALKSRVAELKRQVHRNSHNSSQPPRPTGSRSRRRGALPHLLRSLVAQLPWTPCPLCWLSHLNGVICRSRTFACKLLYLPVARQTSVPQSLVSLDQTFTGNVGEHSVPLPPARLAAKPKVGLPLV